MHMGASGRKIEFCTGFLLAVWLLAAFWGPCVSAEEKNGTVLRVAFPQVEGYTMTDEDGERYGLVVDYLNEIAKYTGWKYEYIDTDNNSVVDNFLEGKFDLMGGTYYSEEFENYFRFLYKGIIIKHNKTEPTYTKTSLFLCEKRRFFMARTEKGVVTTI